MHNFISIQINEQNFEVEAGISVAAALARCGNFVTRISVSGQARAPLCGMGICQECRVSINGQRHQLACQTLCLEQMDIRTGVPA